jgi:predicted enzyme related to lactoylglutathione lyase
MGERTEYTPGTFSWTDLSTTDPEAAKTFYSELLGWNVVDMPAGDDNVYSMADIGGKSVAAISAQPQQQRDAGVPPMWNSYITVQSADDSATKATQLGATVHAPPFDVLDVGRMAVVQDPQGAFFCIWEPKRHIGAGLVNAPGALAWDELASPDLDGSQQFYSELFGWQIEPVQSSPEMEYRRIKNSAGHNNGGMRPVMPPGTPPHWLVYFGSEDIDAALAKAEQLGGKKLTDAMDIGMGKIAVVQDPQGAVFALYSGQFEP